MEEGRQIDRDRDREGDRETERELSFFYVYLHKAYIYIFLKEFLMIVPCLAYLLYSLVFSGNHLYVSKYYTCSATIDFIDFAYYSSGNIGI